MTYAEEATVIEMEKKKGEETVYNLEVKELHNFLVGEFGVVVHNGCTWFDHIFKGEIEITGGVPGAYKFKVSGIHHSSAIDGVTARLKDGTKIGPNSKGYYKSKVQMWHEDNPNNGGWVNKKDPSTFFQDDWTESKVLEEIAEAYSKKKKIKGNKFQGEMSDGTMLEFYIDGADKVENISSAYPIYIPD